MKENIEEEKAIKYYQNKDISFSVDFNTKELLEALGITEEDSFENHQIRFKTLLNLIKKLQKENEELLEIRISTGAHNRIIELEKENEELKHKYDKALSDLVKAEKETILVQTVKDTIEEILNDKECIVVFEGDTENPDDATIIKRQKYIKLDRLEELLKEEK